MYTRSMSWIVSVILGAIQGLTEFIPVSSSGHVIIAEHFLYGAGNHLFVEWINIGTVLALIVFFRRRILRIVLDIFQKRDIRLATRVILAALPAGFVGFFLVSAIEQWSFFTSVWTVVATLVIVGVVMIVLEKLPRLSAVASLDKISPQRALLIGLAQVLSLIPGVSRSGSTIIAGRLTGLNRENAAEFSFLVSIPIMLGVILKLLISESNRVYFGENASALVVANVVAFITGVLAVGFLMKFLKKNELAPFGWYRIGLSLVVASILLLQ